MELKIGVPEKNFRVGNSRRWKESHPHSPKRWTTPRVFISLPVSLQILQETKRGMAAERLKAKPTKAKAEASLGSRTKARAKGDFNPGAGPGASV